MPHTPAAGTSGAPKLQFPLSGVLSLGLSQSSFCKLKTVGVHQGAGELQMCFLFTLRPGALPVRSPGDPP